MTEEERKTDELMKCISELDIDEEAKRSVLDFIQTGHLAKGIGLLRQYRGEILNDLHNNQNKLYEIDFALQKAR